MTMAIALMMEASSTSETSVNFYRTTLHNIPEDSHLHTLRHENLNLTSLKMFEGFALTPSHVVMVWCFVKHNDTFSLLYLYLISMFLLTRKP
jgi:hypothetical protein